MINENRTHKKKRSRVDRLRLVFGLRSGYRAMWVMAVELVEPSFFLSPLSLSPHPLPGQEPAKAEETVNATTTAADRMSFFITRTTSRKNFGCQMGFPSFVRGNAKCCAGGPSPIRSHRAANTLEGFFVAQDRSKAAARRNASPAARQRPPS